MNKNLSNKEKVVKLLNSLENGDLTVLDYVNKEKYIQHNLDVTEGFEGFKTLLESLPKNSIKVNVVRAFEDGDYVFTHTEYDFFGPKAGIDIFRFEEGKIVEHWDNLKPVEGPNPSGHTMFDGPTKIVDLDKTEKNKEVAKDFVEGILMGKNIKNFFDYFNGENYTQHNPNIPDKPIGLKTAFEEMAKNGIHVQYTKSHLILGEGNFALVASEGIFGGTPTAFFDLFRINEGKVCEHWDVMAPIPPKEQHKNNNGKF